jgi:hypothetical protein
MARDSVCDRSVGLHTCHKFPQTVGPTQISLSFTTLQPGAISVFISFACDVSFACDPAMKTRANKKDRRGQIVGQWNGGP